MKKLASIMLCGTLLFSSVFMPQAATVNEVVTQLNTVLGVDSSNLVAYLQTIQITGSQQKTLNAYIDQAQAIVSGKSDLKDLTSAERSQLISIAKSAGSIVGLTVEIAKVGDNAITTTTISANGRSLLTVDSTNIKAVVTDLGTYLKTIDNVVSEVFESDIIKVVSDTNHPTNNNNTSNNFKPYASELKPTGLTAPIAE